MWKNNEDVRSDSATTLEQILEEYVETANHVGIRSLKEWIKKYPQFERELTQLTADWNVLDWAVPSDELEVQWHEPFSAISNGSKKAQPATSYAEKTLAKLRRARRSALRKQSALHDGARSADVLDVPAVIGDSFRCRICRGRDRGMLRPDKGSERRLVCPNCGRVYQIAREDLPQFSPETVGNVAGASKPASDFDASLIRLPRLWLFQQRVSAVLRHMGAQILAIAALMVALITFLGDVPQVGWPIQESLFWASVVCIIAIVVTAARSLDKLPPPEFAKTVLDGRSLDTQFRLTSHAMYQVAHSYLHHRSARRLTRLQREMLRKLWASLQSSESETLASTADAPDHKALVEILRRKYGRVLSARRGDAERLRNWLTHQRAFLQRATQMKLQIARESNISPRRICDHILRFSPAIYERRAAKFVDNWLTIADCLALPANQYSWHERVQWQLRGAAKRVAVLDERSVSVERIFDLLDENERIIRRMEHRRHYLELLAGSKGLFRNVEEFTARSSVRAALMAYSRSIADVARSMLKRPTHWQFFVARRAPEKVGRARMIALYFMQRAHPGVDLHRSLKKLCSHSARYHVASRASALVRHGVKGRTSRSVVTTQSLDDGLESRAAVWEHRARELSKLIPPQPNEATTQGEGGRWQNFLREDVPSTLARFATLPQDVSLATSQIQWAINASARFRLGDAIEALKDEQGNRADILVVTIGYSKSIRDVLKTVVFDLLEPRDTVFVVRTTDCEGLESRFMEFELREDRGWYKPGRSPQLGVGEGKLLRALHCPQDRPILVSDDAGMSDDSAPKIMILMAGRCFDRHGRAVVTASEAKEFRRLDTWASDAEVFVVAESYKFYNDLTKVSEFMRDDLDQIGVLPARATVISDGQELGVTESDLLDTSESFKLLDPVGATHRRVRRKKRSN